MNKFESDVKFNIAWFSINTTALSPQNFTIQR